MATLKRLKFAASSEAHGGEQQRLLFETIDADLEALSTEISQLTAADAAPREPRQPKRTTLPAEHEVQLRKPLSIRALKIFQKKDQILRGMQELHWNGELEKNYVETVERELKREIRDLYRFIAIALRGMRNKVEASTMAEPRGQEAA